MVILIYILLASFLFAPPIVEGLRLEDIIIICMFLYIIIIKKGKIKINKNVLFLLILYLFLLSISVIYNVFSIIEYGSFFGDFSSSHLLKEYFRAGKYFLFFLVSYNILLNKIQYERFVNFFILISSLLAIIGLMQLLNIFNVNEWITTIYGNDSRHAVLVSESYLDEGLGRIMTTFVGPNIYGAFLLFPFSIVLYKFLNKKSFWHATTLLLFTSNVIFTQSRGALFCLIIIIIACVIKTKSIAISSKFLFFIITTSIFLLIFQTNQFTGLNRLTTQINDIFANGILSARYVSMQYIEDIINNSPIFGYSAGIPLLFAPDNEWLIFIHYMGIGGAVFYLLLILVLIFSTYRCFSNPNQRLIFILLIVSIPLIGFSNGYIYSSRIFPIFITMFTIILVNEYKLKEEINRISN